jgi:hypothetical protein
MRRHLAAARSRIAGRADGLLEHLEWRYAQPKTESAIAVVKIEPIVLRPHRECGRNLHSLVSSATDLEKDAILAFERDLSIIEPARGVHKTKCPDEIVLLQALVLSSKAGSLLFVVSRNCQETPPKISPT